MLLELGFVGLCAVGILSLFLFASRIDPLSGHLHRDR
jgi:hypothetical protein